MNFFKKVAVVLFSALSMMAAAHADPIKVRIWSPFGPGGPNDQQVRLLQKHLQEKNPDIQVTVDYKVGAAGVIGLNHFAKLEKSEYVELMVDASNILISRYITKAHSVDFAKDLQILAPIGHTQMLIMSSLESNITNINDIRSTKKSNIIYGSSGVGSISHFTSAYLDTYINKEFVHVAYKGSAAVYPDLVGGRVDMFSVLFNDGVQHVADGKIKAIAITGSQRHPRLPDVKTLEEQGIKNYPINPWFAVFGHPTNDAGQQKKVQQAIISVLADNDIQKSYLDKGIVVTPAGLSNPSVWFAEQILVYQTLAKNPKFASLELKPSK